MDDGQRVLKSWETQIRPAGQMYSAFLGRAMKLKLDGMAVAGAIESLMYSSFGFLSGESNAVQPTMSKSGHKEIDIGQLTLFLPATDNKSLEYKTLRNKYLISLFTTDDVQERTT